MRESKGMELTNLEVQTKAMSQENHVGHILGRRDVGSRKLDSLKL